MQFHKKVQVGLHKGGATNSLCLGKQLLEEDLQMIPPDEAKSRQSCHASLMASNHRTVGPLRRTNSNCLEPVFGRFTLGNPARILQV